MRRVTVHLQETINTLHACGVTPVEMLTVTGSYATVTVGEYASICVSDRMFPRLLEVVTRHLSDEEVAYVLGLHVSRIVPTEGPWL